MPIVKNGPGYTGYDDDACSIIKYYKRTRNVKWQFYIEFCQMTQFLLHYR